MTKLFIASDHAAYELKQKIIKHFTNIEWVNLGTDGLESVDYPDYGKKIAKKVLSENIKGIALCGSGIGISIQVNRFRGIRGALCRNVVDAKMSRLHNDSNILCLGARDQDENEIFEIIHTWLETEFEGDRHIRRINLLDQE